jgi:hypothetical protein
MIHVYDSAFQLQQTALAKSCGGDIFLKQFKNIVFYADHACVLSPLLYLLILPLGDVSPYVVCDVSLELLFYQGFLLQVWFAVACIFPQGGFSIVSTEATYSH